MTEPREVPHRPVRTAEARHAGWSARELAGPLWQRLCRGVLVDAQTDPSEAGTRIDAARAIMPPGCALGGWAALRLLGASTIDGRIGPGGRTLLPVTICVGRSARLRARPQLALDRSPLPEADLCQVGDVVVTQAARACFDVAVRLPLEEAVAMIDSAARSRAVRRDAWETWLAEHPRRRGLPAARRVLRLTDAESRSRPESVLRVLWQELAGLPRPLVNPRLVDADGVVLGEPDLLDPEAGLVAEYDGEHHRGLHQHTADNAREELLESRNLLVVRATAVDLWPRRMQLVARLQAAHARGLARDRHRDHWWLCVR